MRSMRSVMAPSGSVALPSVPPALRGPALCWNYQSHGIEAGSQLARAVVAGRVLGNARRAIGAVVSSTSSRRSSGVPAARDRDRRTSHGGQAGRIVSSSPQLSGHIANRSPNAAAAPPPLPSSTSGIRDRADMSVRRGDFTFGSRVHNGPTFPPLDARKPASLAS